MADQRQLEKIFQGYDIWNTWRNENVNELIDLSEADLRRADLIGINLISANLRGADLNFVCLIGADLRFADLIRANLGGANLKHANLNGANLSHAYLQMANLEKAQLTGANLSKANLSEANLSGAELRGANLSGTELRSAKLIGANLAGVDLTGADLIGADLSGADLVDARLVEVFLDDANLCGADLKEAKLWGACLRGANLKEANLINTSLWGADLRDAILIDAKLVGAELNGANLSEANLSRADLKESNLRNTTCIETIFSEANIENAKIYGISIWDIKADGLIQENLIITKEGEPVITVDNLEVAQFIYLMLNNEKIRDVIGTISKKGVLILGRFTPERKKILDAIREKLREHDFLPILFDFEKADPRDYTETIKILAGLSRFVIADISEPKSSPLELQATIPDYKIPFLPIIQKGEEPFSMFGDLTNYPWVLELTEYDGIFELMENFKEDIIDVAIKEEERLLDQKLKPIKPARKMGASRREGLDTNNVL